METQPLSPQEAHHVWQAMLPELAHIVANTIRKMGLPVPEAEPATARPRAAHRCATFGSVKTRLLGDEQLHEDIIQYVSEQFFMRAVPAGKVWSGRARGWVATALMRATWKLATARAVEYLAEAGASDCRSTLVEELPSGEPDYLSRLCDREDIERAALLLRRLSTRELRLLEAKLSGSYTELERETSISAGTLRVQAHRLCAELRKELEK